MTLLPNDHVSVRGALVLSSVLLSSSLAMAQTDCGYNWPCWNMLNYDQVPVRTGVHYDDDVRSPVLIYLHSNCPYGGSGENEQDYFFRIWDSSTDSSGVHFQGLKHRTTDGTTDSDETRQTGWILAMPNGASDSYANATCLDTGSWALCRYWNATPNCCAYNWYTEGSYTEVDSGAPDHVTYLNNLIVWLKNNYNVDEDRVYIYGYSNGGYMAHRLACENGNFGLYGFADYDADPSGDLIEPQAIAGIGTYAGVTFMNPENCNSLWPTNVLHTHDTGDTECLYAGGIDTEYAGACYPGLPRPYPGAVMTVNSWIALNQTHGEGVPQEAIVPFDLAVPNSFGQATQWSGGPRQAVVELWTGFFGSHAAVLSNTYRKRLIEWYDTHRRPPYDTTNPIDPGSGCVADINGDRIVDGADLTLMLSQWGGSGSADLDQDGAIGGADLALMLGDWGGCEN